MKMPMQPIEDGRFVPNRIVEQLLDTSSLDLNSIAILDFTPEERQQLAQLIGYSLNGYGELGYVDNESYAIAVKMNDGETEVEATISYLRKTLETISNKVAEMATTLFNIHPDDLGGE